MFFLSLFFRFLILMFEFNFSLAPIKIAISSFFLSVVFGSLFLFSFIPFCCCCCCWNCGLFVRVVLCSVSVLFAFFRFRCCLLKKRNVWFVWDFFSLQKKNVIVAAVLGDFVKWNEREEYAIQIIALQAKQKNIEQTNKAKEIFFRLAMPAWMKETHRNDRSTNIFVRKFSTGKFILCFDCVCVCAYHYYYIFCARVNDDLIQWICVWECKRRYIKYHKITKH